MPSTPIAGRPTDKSNPIVFSSHLAAGEMDGDSGDEEERSHQPPTAPVHHPDDSDPNSATPDNSSDGASDAGHEISSPGAVTLAAPGPPPSAKPLALALALSTPRRTGSPAGGGSGREDCWSEGATEALIDAWGDRYVHLSRGNLKHNHWQEVADAVTSRDNYRKPPKTDAQCKNRIDTLKKKYKQEKAKIVAGGAASSPWPFFPKLDRLIGNAPPAASSAQPKKATPSSTTKKRPLPPPPASHPAVSDKLPAAVPTRARTTRHYQANSEESSDGLPPGLANGKRRKGEKGGGGPAGESVRELTRAIERFGEVYERVERTKLKQAVEMEKQRMNLVKELELQRIQFYMKTQMEISNLQSS